MSKIICIAGESGSGKSTSLSRLDPNTTYIINPLGKSLPWRGASKEWNQEKKNLANTSSYSQIVKILKGISESRLDIKTIVVDDATFIMTEEFMARSNEPGYQKYSDIGQHMYLILNTAKSLRDDLTVVFLFHDDIDSAEGMKSRKKIKTVGKMVDNYFEPKALTEILLFTHVDTNNDGPATYSFVTNRYEDYPAKSPMGMFEDIKIPNDLAAVLSKVYEFYHQ